jgi:hypothetical protein
MPRSLVARSLEPLSAILWGVFILWSAWLAAVWGIEINATWLKLPQGVAGTGWEQGAAVLVEDSEPPPNAALRRAILILADHVEIVWLALAVANLHLIISATNGLGTARAWLGFTAVIAFVLGALNQACGWPFGWMSHGAALGPQLLGVAVGWPLLWAVILVSARESVLIIRPRASHLFVSSATAGLVLVTLLNLHPIASNSRVWWAWHDGDVRHPVAMRTWTWLTWGVMPWLMAFAMREKNVVAGAAARPAGALVVLGLLNAAAVAAHICSALVR